MGGGMRVIKPLAIQDLGVQSMHGCLNLSLVWL